MFLLFYQISYCQIESIYDLSNSKSIGFQAKLNANDRVTILLSNNDSSYLLIDTVLNISSSIILLFPEVFDEYCKTFHNCIVIRIPDSLISGLCDLKYIARKKFIYIR